MKKITVALKWMLLVWGAVSLIGLIVAGVIYLRPNEFSEGGPGKSNHLKAADVQHVLNWGELSKASIEQVVHSYESARSFTGDHIDAYAIKVSELAASDLPSGEPFDRKWTRGDHADQVIRDAVSLATGFSDPATKRWLPQGEEVLTAAYYIRPRRIVLTSGLRVTITEIIFVRLSDQMVFYVSVKI